MLQAILDAKGRESLTVVNGLEQFSACLALHANPFCQSKGRGEKYSQTSTPVDIGAIPVNNLGASGFMGGIVSVAPTDVTDSVTAVHYQGYGMVLHDDINHCTYQLSASASGVFTFAPDYQTFPDTGDFSYSNNYLWRNIAAGINIRCYPAPGATSTGTIHAYVIDKGTSMANTLAVLKQNSIADWHAPVSEGVTIRAPFGRNCTRWNPETTTPHKMYLMVIVEWDGAALPLTAEVARYDQHSNGADLGPRQINLDSAFVGNVISAVDYADSNVHGKFISAVPLITSGNSFWSNITSFLKPLVRTVKNVTSTINDLAGKAETFLS